LPARLDADPECVTNLDRHAYPYTNSDFNSYSDGHSVSNAFGHTNTVFYSDGDSYSYTYTDSNCNSDCHCHS
jgi:hypothetical protein